MRTRWLFLLSLALAPVLLAQEAQRMLVPTVYNGPGRRGSYWFGSVIAWNSSSVPWSTPGVRFQERCPIPEGCPAETLPAGRTMSLMIEGDFNFNAPHGFLLYVPAELTDRPAIQTKFHVSEPFAPPYGTELPMPLESEFRTTALRFPVVPINGGAFRTHLRVYGLDVLDRVPLRVRVENTEGQVVAERTMNLDFSPSAELHPSYDELALQDAFPNVGDEFFNIEVVPDAQQIGGAKVWAFITVTADNSNRVGVLTPK
jgi:hypothetical protein